MFRGVPVVKVPSPLPSRMFTGPPFVGTAIIEQPVTIEVADRRADGAAGVAIVYVRNGVELERSKGHFAVCWHSEAPNPGITLEVVSVNVTFPAGAVGPKAETVAVNVALGDVPALASAVAEP